MFKLYLEAFKGFYQQLCVGLSLIILDFLSNPKAYKLKKIQAEKEVSENHINVDLSAKGSSER